MSEPDVEFIDLNGEACRVWRKGAGATLVFFPGHGGMPKWIPFLDRLAENFEVIVPSLPGFPGSGGLHGLDHHMDWVLAARDIIDGAGIADNALLAGSGPGASMAAEIAALWPATVARLALISPWGLFDEADPSTDPWSVKAAEMGALMCADPENWVALRTAPDGVNSVEWPIEQTRALEASARIFWPLGDTRLGRRLGRVTCPTLYVRGNEDRIIPASYADKFRDGITGEVTIESIADAGHLAELDQPEQTAQLITDFMS
ncbi:MAG: alpha/beta fold hydrolase [Rhodospirillaceae bacterium]|nr:alpha/beta fold hydrolase [Rhodospirillaceae bacterium]